MDVLRKTLGESIAQYATSRRILRMSFTIGCAKPAAQSIVGNDTWAELHPDDVAVFGHSLARMNVQRPPFG